MCSRAPRIRILINNAGVALGGRFDQVTVEEFSWVIDVNFRAVVVLTHALLPGLKAEPGSHLVNVSSLFGLIAPAGQTAYAASKSRYAGLPRRFARNWPATRSGSPAYIPAVSTPASRPRPASAAGFRRRCATRAATTGARYSPWIRPMPPTSSWPAPVGGGDAVLVGSSAKVLDVLARLLPSSYGAVLKTATARRTGRRPDHVVKPVDA